MSKTPRLAFAAIVVLLCANSTNSREVIAIEDGRSLYAVALITSVAEMEKSWGKQDDSLGGSRVRTDYHHLFLEKDSEITDVIPSHDGDFRFESLDTQSQIERYKRLEKKYSILKIHTMQGDRSRLRIHVAQNWIEYKKGRLFAEISDWCDVEFQFDCEKNSFMVTSVKLGGI